MRTLTKREEALLVLHLAFKSSDGFPVRTAIITEADRRLFTEALNGLVHAFGDERLKTVGYTGSGVPYTASEAEQPWIGPPAVETPRTDEAEVYYSEIVADGGLYWVKAGFARRLERQLNSVREAIAHDRCDGESEWARGVNAACEKHLAMIDTILREGAKS